MTKTNLNAVDIEALQSKLEKSDEEVGFPRLELLLILSGRVLVGANCPRYGLYSANWHSGG